MGCLPSKAGSSKSQFPGTETSSSMHLFSMLELISVINCFVSHLLTKVM